MNQNLFIWRVGQLFGLVLALMSPSGSRLQADPGVTDTEIVLGQTAVFEGPARALGLGLKNGLEACFNQVNAAGGICGRKIRLVAKDDGYEPDKAIANARELIIRDQVFLLIGGVGTPTAKVVAPICEQARVPFVAPFTGAALLRTPFRKYVVNLRASYGQEMEQLAEYLVDRKKLTRIACFYQNDDYGQAGLKGIETALQRRNLRLVAIGNYERNTVAVKTALLDIRRGGPEAVLLVGTYKACSEFIKLAKRFGLDKAIFCNISFVGTKALLADLGEAAEGVIISQVVPSPQIDNLPVVREYAAALRESGTALDLDWVSLEGYLAGRLFCLAAEKCGRDLTRESFLAAIDQSGSFDLGGFAFSFSPENHQGSNAVYLTMIEGGHVVPLP